MNVLIACEYSGIVRDAFTKMGHNAISCDILESDRKNGRHYTGDVFDLLTNNQWTRKEDYDLIIAHPPCTALAVSGNAWYGKGMSKNEERHRSAAWTQQLWDACKRKADRVCFENPVGVLNRLTSLPRPHYIQPYDHGHLEQKKTGLFLHGLDPLVATANVYDEMMLLPIKQRQRMHYLPPSPDRWKIRSTTYQGIADAMAAQWG